MKKVILHVVVALSFTCAALVSLSGDTGASLTTNDASEVRSKLEAFESEKITLEEATEPGGEAWGHKLVEYYHTHTNEVTTKMKLPISRCYAAMGKYPEAAKLAEEYVNVYSNDWHGWRILGSANYLMENFDAAVNAYTNAYHMGDNKNCAPFALAALKANRLDAIRGIVPCLLLSKDAKETPYGTRLETVMVLVVYSLKRSQKDVFVKAVEGLDTKEISSRDDLEFLVKRGCEVFKATETEKLCIKLAEAGQSESGANHQIKEQ